MKNKTKNLLALTCLFTFFLFSGMYCDKNSRLMRKICGKYHLETFEVNGIDSLQNLNTTNFMCSDHYFHFTEYELGYTVVIFYCPLNLPDTLPIIAWGASKKNVKKYLYFSIEQNPLYTPAIESEGIFQPFLGRWELKWVSDDKFTILRELNGKKYKAHFKQFEDSDCL